MPFIVGSTGSVFPAANRLVVLVEMIEGAAGAKAAADATHVKATIATDLMLLY